VKCSEIDEIYVAVSHLSDAMGKYFEHVRYDVKVTPVQVMGWETGGDIVSVLAEKNIHGPVLVCYGDNITEINVAEIIRSHEKRQANATVALFEVPKEDRGRFGIAEIKDQMIAKFIEKPDEGSTSSNFANAGYFVLETGSLKGIEAKKFKIERELFPIWAREGKLYGHVQKLELWVDIGTIESYILANKLVHKFLPPR
jgi:mannose-1-phosphate guanylyltransferase